MRSLALALALLAVDDAAATAARLAAADRVVHGGPAGSGTTGAAPAPPKPESEPRPEDAELELDAKESATRTLAVLPEDRRLASVLAGLVDSRGGAITAQELEGRDVLLIVSGRKSRNQARDWGAALAERLTGEREPLLLPVADLSTVPERLQKTVSKRLARDPRRLVLDWDGIVSRAHGLEGDGPWLVAGASDGTARAVRNLPLLSPGSADAMLGVARGRP